MTPTFLPQVGGVEFVAHHLAVEWSRQGHEVAVFNCAADAPPSPDCPYSVRRLGLLRGATRFGYHRFPFKGYSVSRLRALLSEFRPDFISAQMIYPTAVWLAGIRRSVPCVATAQGGDITLSEWGYRRRFRIDGLLLDALNRMDRVIAVSSHARMLLENLGVPGGRIADLPNGVDVSRFERRSGFDLRGSLGLPADSLIVLSVGREHPAKGYADGLAAFARVAASNRSAYYLIIGRGTDRWGPLAAQLGLARRAIIRSGYLPEDQIVAAYQQADVFFSPSVQELFPLVVAEAMAAGLPPVVTDVSGNQDAVRDGENGLIVPPGDPEAMAAGLLRVITDASLRSRLAGAARARSAFYAWERISREYLALA